MLSFDDNRWEILSAGYRVPVDLRPLLHDLEFGDNRESTWHRIWEELYHQGDVGEGSFVAIPHLVRIHRKHGIVDWNTYAITVSIELARATERNPDVPEWTREAYEHALGDLARLALDELPRANEDEATQSILALLAVVHGARVYARLLINYTEDEIVELETLGGTL